MMSISLAKSSMPRSYFRTIIRDVCKDVCAKTFMTELFIIDSINECTIVD